MKAISSFDSIQASNGGTFSLLPAGAYLCRIHAVVDETGEQKPHLDVVYDVYDQEGKRFLYADDLRKEDEWWRHTFSFYVGSDFGMQRYKALVEAVEGTTQNNGYRYQNVDGGEQGLVGKWVGFVIRHRLYTGRRGKAKGRDRTALDLAGSITCDDVLAGNYPREWLADRDDRDPDAAAAAMDALPVDGGGPAVVIAESDIPF